MITLYMSMGAECSKLRQPMRAIFALSRAQLIFLVFTRSRELSRECHVTKHKTPARINFPLSNFENSGTIQFSSSSSTSRGLFPKNFEKREHPNSHLLNEQFKITDTLNSSFDSYRGLWDTIKYTIKDRAIMFGKNRKKENRMLKSEVQAAIYGAKSIPNFINDSNLRKQLFDSERGQGYNN